MSEGAQVLLELCSDHPCMGTRGKPWGGGSPAQRSPRGVPVLPMELPGAGIQPGLLALAVPSARGHGPT